MGNTSTLDDANMTHGGSMVFDQALQKILHKSTDLTGVQNKNEAEVRILRTVWIKHSNFYPLVSKVTLFRFLQKRPY